MIRWLCPVFAAIILASSVANAFWDHCYVKQGDRLPVFYQHNILRLLF